jgi:hypothetical protein
LKFLQNFRQYVDEELSFHHILGLDPNR